MSKIQNIDVRFNASSNFAKVKADLAAVEAQAASLGNVFAQNAYAKPPALVDPVSWKKGTNAIHGASNAYRDAVSSSGLLTSQQIRATAESEKFTKSLQKQKLTISEMTKQRGVMRQAYQDQLRYQRMTAQYWGTDSAGRAVTDITIPKNVPRELDTIAQKLYFTGQMAKSAGTQIINMGKNMQWAGRQLMVGFTYPAALFGAAAGVMAYKVDEAMTQVTKVYDVSADAQRSEAMRVQELNDVRARSWDIATKGAEKYGQSVEDTLGVEAALAATGLSGDKLFESTDAVSRISALGDLDFASSTDMAIALQTAFKDTIKTTDDLNEAFNFMNAVENATSLSIKDIAEATPRAASAMSALGVTVEEMTVLLTAMRESGVNAAEGANALKSATGTILKPSPAAIEFVKEIAGNKIAKSMENLRESTGGNLYQAIKQIYDLTKDLSGSDRQAIITTMFGKYQFNRVSALVTNLGEAFDGTENQAKKAMDLMGENSKNLADSAERELAQKMEAVSGRFNTAWQSMRIELAKTGEPFLEVAIIATDVAKEILGFFNGMENWKKKAVLGVAAVLAIAGPIVMVGGLFMNMAGQFVSGSGKIASALGRAAGAFGLITKEGKMASLSASAQNKAMDTSASRTSTLAAEVNVLTAAYEKATVAARALAQQQGIIPASASVPSAKPVAGSHRGATYTAPIGPQLPAVSLPYTPGASASDRATAMRAAQVAEMQRLQTQQQITNQANREAALRERIRTSISGAAIGTGVMAAATAAMMLPLGETTSNIAKWAMIGTIAAPALKSMVSGGNALATGMGTAFSNVRNTATGMTAMGTAMASARAGAIGFGAALNTALGPVGWIALGLTAVVGTLMTIKNHNDKIAEEQQRVLDENLAATKTMQESTRSIATDLGKAAGSYKQIRNVGGVARGAAGNESQMLRSYNYYKSDEGMEETKALQMDGKLLETDALMNKVRGQFIDLQVIGSNTAEQAKTDVEAMMLAAGMSSSDAARMATEIYREYGNVKKIDWTKPIKDQTDALDGLARKVLKLNTELYDSGGGYVNYVAQIDVDENAKKALYLQAEKSSEIFNEALARAASPKQAREIIDQYMTAATSQWQVGYEELVASDGAGSSMLKDLFAQYGIDSGKAFAAAMREDGAFEEAYLQLAKDPRIENNLKGQMTFLRKFAIEYEHAFIEPLASSSWYLSDTILTAVSALKEFAEAGVGMTPDGAVDALIEENEAYKKYAEIQRQMAVYENSNANGRMTATRLGLQNELNSASKDLVPIINELNQHFGFKQGKTAAQALAFLMGKVKVETKEAKDEAKGVADAVDKIPTQKTVNIRMNQVGGIVQSAMSSVQGRMADSAMNSFNDRWDNSMDAAQGSWDTRMDNMTNSHQNAQDAMSNAHQNAQSAMDRAQENAQDAFDRRWEARKEAVEKEYDQRIARVNRTIEAEKKADEVRQNLFDREMERLKRLADNANVNIDFNTQLNEGDLDEAAKTLNNAGVDSGNAQMEAEQRAAEKRSEARIAALEKKNERLEKARDKELENLEKLEERMRKHLDRVQDARRRALEKQQADEVKALEKSQANQAKALEAAEEAAMASMQNQRDYEEALLDERLELFKSYTARNQKDLERWMKKVGLTYDDFGSDVKAKGDDWSKHFREELSAQIHKAGVDVMNDNLWEKVGKGMANKLLKGLGFDNLAQFNKFVRTGQKGGQGGKGGDVETRHEGGMIGSGTGSRKGVPNTYKGLHRSEKMVRAQKGEFMVNKKSTKNNLGILEAINKGTDVSPTGEGGIGDAGYGGPAALMAGAAAKMFEQGVAKAFQNNYAKGVAKQQVKAGKYGGEAGMYGGRQFSAAQMKNAATIASVGASMGMSSRDIMIGIMTAIAESGLVNVNHGHLDSLGLFQQRPTMGWGTPAQVTDPHYAARAFFGPLKAHGERTDESPWMAAQHIQRSAFADGSNYRVWWEAAQQIFNKGLSKKAGPGGSSGYVVGSGGTHRPINNPVTYGLHGGSNSYDPPAVDMATGTGVHKPVYAVADGVITSSRDIAGPLPTDRYRGDGPYGSFGRMIQMKTDSGHGILYGHLSQRYATTGQRVKGGAKIGLSGNSGNSSGDHLHFGATNGPYAWLRKGGEIKYDNTHVVAHKGETMLSAPVTRQLKENISSGGGDFHVTLDLRGAMIKEDVDIEKAVNRAIDTRESKLGRRRVVR